MPEGDPTGNTFFLFIFHAKERPVFMDGNVIMNMGRQLRDVSKGFELVN